MSWHTRLSPIFPPPLRPPSSFCLGLLGPNTPVHFELVFGGTKKLTVLLYSARQIPVWTEQQRSRIQERLAMSNSTFSSLHRCTPRTIVSGKKLMYNGSRVLSVARERMMNRVEQDAMIVQGRKPGRDRIMGRAPATPHDGNTETRSRTPHVSLGTSSSWWLAVAASTSLAPPVRGGSGSLVPFNRLTAALGLPWCAWRDRLILSAKAKAKQPVGWLQPSTRSSNLL